MTSPPAGRTLPDGGTGLPEGREKTRAVRDMFDRIAPGYDRLNRILTFGLDRRWRRTALDATGLGSRDLVVDLAAGTGDLCEMLLEMGCRPVAVDPSLGMLQAAKARFGMRTLPLVGACGEALPFPDGSVDAVTCGFAMRNFTDLDAVLAEVGRIVRPGGHVCFIDVDEPDNPFLAAGHRVYFHRVVPLVGGLLSDRSAYSYLPKSAAYLPEPQALTDAFGRAGFGVERLVLGSGIAQAYVGTRVGSSDLGPVVHASTEEAP